MTPKELAATGRQPRIVAVLDDAQKERMAAAVNAYRADLLANAHTRQARDEIDAKHRAIFESGDANRWQS